MIEPAVDGHPGRAGGHHRRGFVRELIDTYLDDSPRLLDELRQGLSGPQRRDCGAPRTRSSPTAPAWAR